MMKLIVKKGDLFTPHFKRRVIAHACNAKGVWGSGIAPEFKTRYPWAFDAYASHCKHYGKEVVGMGQLILDPNDTTNKADAVGCLYTSYGYGQNKDNADTILANTALAVEDLLKRAHPHSFEIHTPKINSGKFAVPWERTEAIINSVLSRYNHTWIVWEL